jgi:hypothetical protein
MKKIFILFFMFVSISAVAKEIDLNKLITDTKTYVCFPEINLKIIENETTKMSSEKFFVTISKESLQFHGHPYFGKQNLLAVKFSGSTINYHNFYGRAILKNNRFVYSWLGIDHVGNREIIIYSAKCSP